MWLTDVARRRVSRFFAIVSGTMVLVFALHAAMIHDWNGLSALPAAIVFGWFLAAWLRR